MSEREIQQCIGKSNVICCARGDRVIARVARLIRAQVREGDACIRYGGEEFCLILPGSNLEEARVIAERIRTIIHTKFGAKFSWDIDLTISMGVASIRGDRDTTTDLLNRADKALYAAKEHGRNRVVAWGDPELDAPPVPSAAQRHTSHAALVRETMSVKSGQ